MILDRPLEVTISDLTADLDGAEALTQACLNVAGRGLGERQTRQGGDPARGVERIAGCHRLP